MNKKSIEDQLVNYFDAEELEKKLRSGRIPISTKTYLFLSVISTFLVLLVGVILVLLTLNELMIIVGIIVSGIISLAVFISIYYYPNLKCISRSIAINLEIDSAVTFMYGLSVGDMDLPEIFRRLAKNKESYGEVAKEAEYIVTLMDYFSEDVISAIRETIMITPSEKMKDFLSNLLLVVRAGGDVPSYLEEKSEQYLNESFEEQESYIEFLGYLSEAYIVIMVVGPLLIILGLTILALSFGNLPKHLELIIFSLLSLGGLFFIIIIELVSPEQNLSKKITIEEEEETYGIANSNKSNARWNRWKRFKERVFRIKNLLIFNPTKTLYITAPISVVYLIYIFFTNKIGLFIQYIEINSLIFALILLAPLSFFYEIKSYRENKIKKQFPDFIRLINSLNRTGMTLKGTLLEISEFRGIVGEAAKKMKKGIYWDVDVRELMKRFSNKLRNPEVLKNIVLILEGVRAHDDVSEVLQITTNSASNRKKLRKKKRTQILPYLILVWISFLIFLFIAFILQTQFMGNIPISETTYTNRGAFNFSPQQFDEIKDTIVHSTMLVGFLSGIVAGKLTKSTLSGIKHGLLMLILSYLTFFVII
ncbi:MAG: Pilus assembly protein TadC [Candidatus Methanohalarchaeum thermophilum]|uniref:Pilus assembly protein TadC n=1 Tax=Methanohalarchaeum thermophilum TaxID=1903181 RepID=A0A1Q6DVB5_METT1|nr:MAG: Pilus assembly protein TadC [Candidatus Methanohalarchaeum thermophilum]